MARWRKRINAAINPRGPRKERLPASSAEALARFTKSTSSSA